MTERWVVNASPIICLAKVGCLELLQRLPDQFLIPQAVADEILAGPHGDPAFHFITENREPIVEVNPDPLIMAWDLEKERRQFYPMYWKIQNGRRSLMTWLRENVRAVFH